MTISITFKDQKNREKIDTIATYLSRDVFLCPVEAWDHTLNVAGPSPAQTKLGRYTTLGNRMECNILTSGTSSRNWS